MTNLDKELINYLPSNSPTTQYMLDEIKRQDENIELIASENFVSDAVRAACASVFTNKYAEGKPHKRYYNGCDVVDKIEELSINSKLALLVPWLGDMSSCKESTYDFMFGHFEVSSKYLIKSYVEEHSTTEVSEKTSVLLD